MVAPITRVATGELQSVHVTFLAADGSGKAAVDLPRLYLGPKSNGCVRLTPDDEITYGLCIGEGIETCLTAIVVGYPAWSLLDAGNMAAFPVLPGIENLTVLADHDEAGERAAATVARRWKDSGAAVHV